MFLDAEKNKENTDPNVRESVPPFDNSRNVEYVNLVQNSCLPNVVCSNVEASFSRSNDVFQYLVRRFSHHVIGDTGFNGHLVAGNRTLNLLDKELRARFGKRINFSMYNSSESTKDFAFGVGAGRASGCVYVPLFVGEWVVEKID